MWLQWAKDAFGPEGWKFFKNSVAASVKRLDMPKRIERNRTYPFEHFNSDEFLKTWKAQAESEFHFGFSSAELVRSPNGHALFRGVLDNRLPDDGLTENSGFVALIGPSAPKNKFFQVETSFDWRDYNTFEMRFRGDGRKYQIVVNTAAYHNDFQYYDNYSYPLYTRGGPYWQTIRVPFQKFVFCYKNLAQDQQSPLPAFKVKFVAIALQDRNDGPFSLEIDYMGLRQDDYGTEEFSPYETYQFPHIRYRQTHLGCDPPES